MNAPPGYHFETMLEIRKHYSPDSYRLISYDEARLTGVLLNRNLRVGGGAGKRSSHARNGGKRGKRETTAITGTQGEETDHTTVSEPSAKPSAEMPAKPSVETPANVP